jgi:tRNA1Val (adenine37-N6)-methyltransferase
MAGSIFKFKQFEVDQTGCAMKVNTDGVLIGALAVAHNPQSIVDIGTGTGVIALMLAQRFAVARIDGVDIDEPAAKAAERNFATSPFKHRLSAHFDTFEGYFKSHNLEKYDLIVSNPPFFLDSLASADEQKRLAKHTDSAFFKKLLRCADSYLTETGTCQLILPLPTAAVIKELSPQYTLHLQNIISVKSFTDSEPHREILTFGKGQNRMMKQEFVIYDAPKIYSPDYQLALADFLTIF